MTDAARTIRMATSKPPPTITCADKRRCTTVGPTSLDSSARAAARSSVAVVAGCGEVDLSSIAPRTSTILLEHLLGAC
jgi:hypothetical protein